MENSALLNCPICNRIFPENCINDHVDKCLFLHSKEETQNTQSTSKRESMSSSDDTPFYKKTKLETTPKSTLTASKTNLKSKNELSQSVGVAPPAIPLAEKMRPTILEDYIGQIHILGKDTILRQLLIKKDFPSMILWGPPGCGKTSLANVISNLCKNESMRFVKLSATMSGINDIKEVVKVAKNEAKFKRQTILFMDEIHRFNKLQQDTFLPHIENGTIVLIGATTENPSFSLNSALLSRCRVIVLEKLSTDDILKIIVKALEAKYSIHIMDGGKNICEVTTSTEIPRMVIELNALRWLSEICDGDARIALNSVQLALQAKDPGQEFDTSGPTIVSLEDIKDGIKRSHLLYDRKGEEHYNMISALHKSIRASDENATLYWLTRMLQGGEDPSYIARRMVRIAGEDIGMADPKALNLTVSCMRGCQLIGMPECDVLLAQCAVYLARTDKSTEVYHALQRCKQNIADHKGPLPSVPLHLRNAPTKLMSQLGYGKGYNTKHKDESNLTYMPEGMEEMDYFH